MEESSKAKSNFSLQVPSASVSLVRVVVVRVDRQILELDGGGARLEGLVLSHHLHELDGVVGGSAS